MTQTPALVPELESFWGSSHQGAAGGRCTVKMYRFFQTHLGQSPAGRRWASKTFPSSGDRRPGQGEESGLLQSSVPSHVVIFNPGSVVKPSEIFLKRESPCQLRPRKAIRGPWSVGSLEQAACHVCRGKPLVAPPAGSVGAAGTP